MTSRLRALAAGRATASSGAMVAAALAVVYVVWGSTYYSIRVAIDTMPPLLMGAVRFTVAGGPPTVAPGMSAPRPRPSAFRRSPLTQPPPAT